ncbi:MAG: methyltransferase domain-containing protein [Actinomycetota bacterium]|nr:methyltransferase domain-containing protein [Actinomycetota bacterium]
MTTETDRVRLRYETFARTYDRQVRFFERVLFPGGREWVCGRAQGDTLEIAAGTGRNLFFYPPEVRVTGIELSPAMLDVARRRAAALGRDVDLRLGDAQALEFADQSFDTVVCTLGLCTIPDDHKAVAEARRVLRPGGRVLLLEHVRSPVPTVRAVQRLLEPLFRWIASDHLLREPLEHLKSEGFDIEEVRRSKWGIVEQVQARKPEGRDPK